MESRWSHTGVTVESRWSHGGVTVESHRSHAGVTVESRWSHAGVTVESRRSHGGHGGVTVESHRSHEWSDAGVTVESRWSRTGVTQESCTVESRWSGQGEGAVSAGGVVVDNFNNSQCTLPSPILIPNNIHTPTLHSHFNSPFPFQPIFLQLLFQLSSTTPTILTPTPTPNFPSNHPS